jgi:hypothetical protein
MGCLSAPFKLLGCLGLIVVLALGWLYRDRLLREGRRLVGGVETVNPPAATGRPGSRALNSARSKIDSLNGWRADSVVLTPAEMASLVGSSIDPSVREQIDSLKVRLLQGEVAVSGRLHTDRLPKELLGPLAMAMGRTEPVEATGPIRVLAPGKGEWVVRSLKLRDFPVPADVVPQLVSRALGDSTRKTVPLRVPAGVRDIRIRPSGATLYGAPRS